MLEKTPDSPLDCKEIKPVDSKGNQSWTFIGRTNAEAEAPILWPSERKSQLTRKDPDAGKDSIFLKAEREGDDSGWDGWMASPTQWILVWATSGRRWRTGKSGVSQSIGHDESDMTEQLNNTNVKVNWKFPWICQLYMYHNDLDRKYLTNFMNTHNLVTHSILKLKI